MPVSLEGTNGGTGMGILSITSMLTGKSKGSAEILEHIKNIDSVMSESHINQDVVLHRGVPGKHGYDVLEFFLGGHTTYIPKTYITTFTQQRFAHAWQDPPVVLRMHVKKGTPACDPEESSSTDCEHQCLLDRGMVFKADKMFKVGGKVYVEGQADYVPDVGKIPSKDKGTVKVDAPAKATPEQEAFAETVAAIGQLCMTEDDLNSVCAQFIQNDGTEWVPERVKILRARIATQVEQNRKDSPSR